MAAVMAGQAMLPGVDWLTSQDGVRTYTNPAGACATKRGSLYVRPFIECDIPGMIECGRAMHAESRYSHIHFDEAKMVRHIRAIPDNFKTNWCGFVAVDEDEEVQGVIGGYITTYPFSDDTVAYDFVLFVQPHARGGLAAKKLALEYVKWAQSRHAQEIIIGVSSGVADERVGRLYEMIGFKPLAKTYVYVGDQL